MLKRPINIYAGIRKMSDFNDPKFKKYKMLFKMHLPEGAIRQKMGADGLADLADEYTFKNVRCRLWGD